MRRLICLFLLICLSACSYRVEKLPSADDGAADFSSLNSFDYKEIQQFVLGEKCLECHSWAAPNQYVAVSSRISTIKDFITGKIMPPSNASKGPLSANEYSALMNWLERGGPLVSGNGSTGSAPVEPPLLPVCGNSEHDPLDPCIGFNEIRALVFPKCKKCHGFTRDYDVAFAKKEQITFMLEAFVMPPAAEAQLTNFERTLLLNWISKGAKKKVEL